MSRTLRRTGCGAADPKYQWAATDEMMNWVKWATHRQVQSIPKAANPKNLRMRRFQSTQP